MITITTLILKIPPVDDQYMYTIMDSCPQLLHVKEVFTMSKTTFDPYFLFQSGNHCNVLLT